MGRGALIGVVAVAAIVLALAAYMWGQRAGGPVQTATSGPLTTATSTTAAATQAAGSQTAARYTWVLRGVYVAANDSLLWGRPLTASPPPDFLTPKLVNVTPTEGRETVEIGVVLPLSGTLGSLGQMAVAAAQLAADDVNAYLTSIGSPLRVKLVVADSQGNVQVSLQQMQSLAARGVRLYVGPRTSAEVRAWMQYAKDNKLVCISPSSNAAGLAVPGKWIYRLVPVNAKEARAITRLLADMGVRVAVVIHRNDDFGRDLARGIEAEAPRRGLEYVAAAAYDPQKGEFSAEVSLLAQRVREAVSRYGADKVAVVAIGFNELQTVVLAARGYPELWQVRWILGSGAVGLPELLAPAAAEFLVKVNALGTKFAVARSAYYDRVRGALAPRFGELEAYTYNAYDAVWLLAYSILQAGSADSERVYAVLPQVASRYFGASGWTKLDANGDRDVADYEVWAVAPS